MMHHTPMHWPSIETLVSSLSLPDGVTLRLPREDELATLPALLADWYSEIRVGAESVFLSTDFLKTQVVCGGNLEPNIYATFIVQNGVAVGFTTYERQPANAMLHARVGVLAPEPRSGFLGALGFMALEKLASLTGAELILA